MKEQDVRSLDDLLRYISYNTYSATIEIEGEDTDVEAKITGIDLDPFDKLTVTSISVNKIADLPARCFDTGFIASLSARVIHDWWIEGEAQCHADNVLMWVEENTGHRTGLYTWFERCGWDRQIERRSATVDFLHDQRKEVING